MAIVNFVLAATLVGVGGCKSMCASRPVHTPLEPTLPLWHLHFDHTNSEKNLVTLFPSKIFGGLVSPSCCCRWYSLRILLVLMLDRTHLPV